MNESDGRSRQPTRQQEAGQQGDAGSGLQFRAGGRVLSVFSSTLHGAVLRSLADGPVPLAELHGRAGGPPQKALRGSIGNLIGLGAVERRRPDGDPHLVDNGLTPLGRDLLAVADVVESWLSDAPAGPLDVEAAAAREALKALIAGWGSTMLRALTVRPLSLTELDSLMKAFSPSAVERRLARMRLAGQVETVSSGDGNGVAYAVTDWLRQAAAPLLAAIHCERLHLPEETAPPTRIDLETLFLLSVPLLRLPDGTEGRCQLVVSVDGDRRGDGLAGVSVVVERGRIVSCVSTLEREPAGRAQGSLGGWLEALVLGDCGGLEFGRRRLPRALVEALQAQLTAST